MSDPLRCTKEFVSEWRCRTVFSEHPVQGDLDGADDVLHDAEVAHDLLAELTSQQSESARRLALMKELSDALEAEAKASMTLTTAQDNFSKYDIEARQYERALIRVTEANKAVRAEVEAAKGQS